MSTQHSIRAKNLSVISGFTLIEILVVMIIIGIASSIIVISVGSSYFVNKRSEVIAHEMVSLIELAKKQAIFSMNTLGLKITPANYSFVILDTNAKTPMWNELGRQDSFWTPRAISKDVIVTYQVQGQDQDQASFLKNITNAPQIMIFPSGEMTPFTIQIRGEQSAKTYLIKGNYTGIIETGVKE